MHSPGTEYFFGRSVAPACEKVERISQFVDFIALRKGVCPLGVYGDIVTCTASCMSDKRRNSNTI